MNNFIDPETKEEFFIPNYYTKYTKNGKVFLDSQDEELINPKNNKKLIPIEKEWDGGIPSEGTGMDARGKEKIKNMLKKRSNTDFKKNHEWNRGRMIHNFDTKGEQGL